jgi:hypothetical protein
MERVVTIRAIAEDDGRVIFERPLVLNKKSDILLVEVPSDWTEEAVHHTLELLEETLKSERDNKIIAYREGMKIKVLSVR